MYPSSLKTREEWGRIAGGADPATRVVCTPSRGVLCHLIASNFAGGPEKQILELSKQLTERGWKVIIGSFRENRSVIEIVDRAREAGHATFLIDTRSSCNPAAVRQLLKFLRLHHVDVLVTHGYKGNLIGYLANRWARILQVPVIRGYTAEDWKVRVYERVDRLLLRRFRVVLCVSEATRATLSRHGICPERMRVVHNAVKCESVVLARDLRREFGLPQRSRILVAAGRLSPEKGHRYLVEGMRILATDLPHCYAIILGSGKEEGNLRRQVEAAGLADRIVLGGFRSNILEYIAGADVVINPSLSEGLPNVVLEALSLRVPVIATDVGGVREIVIPGKTGWLVPRADPGSLAETIRQVLSDDDSARKAGENGYCLVSDRFSFSSQAALFENALAEAMLGRRRNLS